MADDDSRQRGGGTDPPEWLLRDIEKLKPKNDDEWWDRLERRFHESASMIGSLRMETRDEANTRTYSEWLDEETGLKVRAWLLLPYRRAWAENNEQDSPVASAFEAARMLIPELEVMLRRRELTLEFVDTWGAYWDAAGFIDAVDLTKHDDLGPERAAQQGRHAKSVEPQRKWIAHLIARELVDGRVRKQAQPDVESAVVRFIDAGEFPDPWDRAWYEKMLTKERELKSTYSPRKLTNAEVKRLAADLANDVPPTNILIPRT